MSVCRIACWNLDWLNLTSPRNADVACFLQDLRFDVLILSETLSRNNLGCHIADGGDHWGYRSKPGRRKIAILSKNEWRDVWIEKSLRPLLGRYVSGTTSTSLGDLRVIGACIPWDMCHVSTGARDCSPWQEMLAFLVELAERIEQERAHGLPLILAGDFNLAVPQKHPRNRQAYGQLIDLLAAARLRLFTEGARCASEEDRLLNHVASNLATGAVEHVWSGIMEGRKISDHCGALVEFC